MTLIDKSALVAEIEKRKKELMELSKELIESSNVFANQWACGSLDNILSFLDTIEAKDFDFEKELDRIWFTDGLGNHFDNDAMDFAHIRTLCRYFFELGLKAQKGELYED